MSFSVFVATELPYTSLLTFTVIQNNVVANDVLFTEKLTKVFGGKAHSTNICFYAFAFVFLRFLFVLVFVVK